MASPTDFPARGRVKSFENGKVVFLPAATNYEVHLLAPSYDGPIDEPVQAIIRVQARKVYSVPSGGNFIAPIFGPPKIIQGRVKFAEGQTLVIQAGTNFVIDLPGSGLAIDLNSGPLAVGGAMVNVVALPGATFELLKTPAGV